jgi:hypothetical protein
MSGPYLKCVTLPSSYSAAITTVQLLLTRNQKASSRNTAVTYSVDKRVCNNLKTNLLAAKLLLVLASLVIFGSGSHGTHDHILKTEFILNNIYKFGLYLTGNTFLLRYKAPPVNVV